jgi:hypothetical protein
MFLSTLSTSPGAGRHRKTDRYPALLSSRNIIMLVSTSEVSQGRFRMLSQDFKKHLSHLGRHREYDTAMPGVWLPRNRLRPHVKPRHLPSPSPSAACDEIKRDDMTSPHPERAVVSVRPKLIRWAHPLKQPAFLRALHAKPVTITQQPGTARHSAHAHEWVISVTGALGEGRARLVETGS